MKALDMDLRERILAAVLDGKESMPKIAERFSVSYKVVQKLKYQWRDLGTLEPQTHHCGRKRAFSEKQSKNLDRLIRENPSWTLEQLRQKLRMDRIDSMKTELKGYRVKRPAEVMPRNEYLHVMRDLMITALQAGLTALSHHPRSNSTTCRSTRTSFEIWPMMRTTRLRSKN